MVWANGPTPGDKRDFGGEPQIPRDQNQKSTWKEQ